MRQWPVFGVYFSGNAPYSWLLCPRRDGDPKRFFTPLTKKNVCSVPKKYFLTSQNYIYEICVFIWVHNSVLSMVSLDFFSVIYILQKLSPCDSMWQLNHPLSHSFNLLRDNFSYFLLDYEYRVSLLQFIPCTVNRRAFQNILYTNPCDKRGQIIGQNPSYVQQWISKRYWWQYVDK